MVSVIVPYKLWTVHKHITLWRYAIDPLILAASKITWDGLTPADREIVEEDAPSRSWPGRSEGARAGLDGSTEAVDMLKKNGMQVVTLSKDEVAAFRARTEARLRQVGGQGRRRPREVHGEHRRGDEVS